MIAGIAYARAGLLGNPSDGYFGKVLAISVKNFAARVVIEESAELRILPSSEDGDRFSSIREFAAQTHLYGHYGGVCLIKAALKKFHDYSLEAGLPIHDRNFSVRYESSIPRQVGLGGSSAIITAAMRAFMAFYGLSIPVEILPSLVLSAERDELDINAGFMDRVTQVYEGCVYMDLDCERFAERGYGIYERLDAALLPELYLAYKPALGKISGRVLNEIRMNYDQGDRHTITTLGKIAGLAESGRDALLRRDYETLSRFMDENFELRRSIMTITRENDEMIETARACGASATFAGSGGSIVGVCRGESMYERIAGGLGKIGAIVVRPIVT